MLSNFWHSIVLLFRGVRQIYEYCIVVMTQYIENINIAFDIDISYNIIRKNIENHDIQNCDIVIISQYFLQIFSLHCMIEKKD